MPKRRLLIAEDDAALREILVEGLEEEGFTVVAVPDGREALRRIQGDDQWDALLLDDEMPHVRGREILERVRSAGHAVPVLLLSGHLHLDDDEQRRLAVGPVLRKPCSIAELTRALREAIDAAQAGGGSR